MIRRILLTLAALATPAHAADRKPLVIGSTGQNQQIQSGDTLDVANGSSFSASPNWVGNASDFKLVGVDGTTGTPSTTAAPVAAISKTANVSAFNSFGVIANKKSSASNARGTAVYGEAVDLAGGSTSFVEGGRFQGVLSAGVNGSAYGSICAAGTNASGPTTPAYLIGCEGEVTKQVGSDAPTYGSFNANAFTASFNATAGVGVGSVKKVDAAIVVNPYSVGKFRTGLLLTSAVDDTGIAAASGSSMANAIDVHMATLSYSALWAPNNVPIRASNAAGSNACGMVRLDSSDSLVLGDFGCSAGVKSDVAVTLNGASTHWSQNGAKIHRFNDRVFIGAMTANDGAYPNVAKDWLSTLQVAWGNTIGYPTGSVLNVSTIATSDSQMAITGAARTNYFTNAAQSAIGVQGFAVADNTTYAAKAWGLYGEAHLVSGSGGAYGIEVDPVAHITSIAPTPNQQGNVVGYQVACGGSYSGFTQYDCSNGIQFAANGAKFKQAITVTRGSVTTGGLSLALPTGNGIGFYDAVGHLGGAISASFTAGTTANLGFDDNGLQIASTNGSGTIAYFFQSASPVNYLTFNGNGTGNAPKVAASGSDTNIDLELAGKGTGAAYTSNGLRLKKTTVSGLPTCNAAAEGTMIAVTDATSTTFNAALAGSGANHVVAYCNGTGWTVH